MDNSLISKFYDWMLKDRGITPETAKYYVSVVKRGEWLPDTRAKKKAWRAYIEYLSNRGVIDYLTKMSYLDMLKLTQNNSNKSKTQPKIPLDKIIEIKERMEELGLGDLFIIGLGGTRLAHIILMLNTFNPDEVVQHPTNEFEPRLHIGNGFARYYLGIRHGRKRCDYVYFPAININKQQLNYRNIKDKLHHVNINFSLLRKFAEQQLTILAHHHNIPLDAVKLILSRGLSVSGIHYLNTRDWADKLFKLYVNELSWWGVI